MADNLLLWELQKTHNALSKAEDENTHNFRFTKPYEKFLFIEPILNTTN